MSDHSPLPWEWQKRSEGEITIRARIGKLGEPRKLLAENWDGMSRGDVFVSLFGNLYFCSKPSEEWNKMQRANAALIVKSVNHHQQMLDALRMQHDVITKILTDPQLDARTECGETVRRYLTTTNAVIASAEGR